MVIGGFFILLNLFLTSWYVLHQDIIFSSDIARDFLLFKEIDEKKIILIGPRSSVSGLYHGPVWLYLNYPAYLIGKGNPVVVGWYWIFLTILFLIVSFKIAEKLFGRTTAYFYTLFLSQYAIFHTKSMFNPHGVFFLLPLFYFLLIKYLETSKPGYLISHLIIGGLLIQLELAIGIPYIILSSVLIIRHVFKKKKFTHLFAFLLIPVCLANFIIFDLRHEFLLTKAVGQFLSAHTRDQETHYWTMIKDDLRLIFTGAEIIRANPFDLRINLRLFSIVMVAIFIWRQIKDKIHKEKYLVFLYLYLGYFLVSFANKGFILYFYLFPQFSLVFLIFTSLITSKYKKIFFVFFLLIFSLNFYTTIKDTQKSITHYIGKDSDSWKFLYRLSQKVYQGKEETFGYFIFSPDSFAYQPKYAMLYTDSLFDKKVYSFEKKPITYIIAAPHPYMKDKWWKENQINIVKEPELTISYPNGYKIEKYQLTEEEITIPFDPSINPGIHFR